MSLAEGFVILHEAEASRGEPRKCCREPLSAYTLPDSHPSSLTLLLLPNETIGLLEHALEFLPALLPQLRLFQRRSQAVLRPFYAVLPELTADGWEGRSALRSVVVGVDQRRSGGGREGNGAQVLTLLAVAPCSTTLSGFTGEGRGLHLDASFQLRCSICECWLIVVHVGRRVRWLCHAQATARKLVA